MIDMDSTESGESEKRMMRRRILRAVVEGELSPRQREILIAYHIHGKSTCQIAREQGVNSSTVTRTLRRAERNVRRITRYI